MEQQAAAKRWRGDVWRWAWLRLAVRGSVVYTLVWGVVALVVRVLIEDSAAWLWWGGLGLIGVWGAVAWVARRQVPSEAQTLALFDRENRLGGLLMVGDVEGAEAWAKRAAGARVPVEPRLRWRGGPSGGALALATAFVLAAMLVPMPGPAAADSRLDVSRSIAEMQQRLDVLKEEKILEAPEADQVRDAMKRIGEQAKGDDPSKTWEALDHLAEKIEQAADEAAELAQRRMDEAAGAEALAKALGEGGDTLSPERLGEAMSTLAELMEAASGAPTLDGMELPEGLAEALSQSGLDASMLDPEMLKQLADAMEGRQAELLEMIESLCEAGMCEGSGTGKKLRLAEIDPDELLDWLESTGECDGEGLLVACKSIRAGRGGINRGPGHAEMVWQDPSSKEGVEFAPELLPPSRMRDLRDSQMLGASRGAPQDIEGAAGSSGGALTHTAAGGGSAVNTVVLPRHRGAVTRYFERTNADE
ncbi:MAG: hypothetical protein AAF333_06335 [Planctomycetota bacterium]